MIVIYYKSFRFISIRLTSKIGECYIITRLVVRGDMAVEGFDYFETFSPVAKIESVRLVIVLIITHRFLALQTDINNSFV